MKFLVFIFALALPAYPQADVATATLKGSVTDPSGAVIPAATVQVEDRVRGILRTDLTDESGNYQFVLIPPGRYQLRISSPGFKTHVLNGVELTVGLIQLHDVQLSLGDRDEQIVVNADPPLVEPERPQQANTISQMQIENLPNLTRSFTNYVFVLPGVTNSNAPRDQNPGFTFSTSGFSIGGSNGRSNLVTVDGGENEYGSGSVRVPLSVEVVQEFQVNRNSFAAEFGFTAGTAVNVITRGGTNQIHGSGYSFYRSQHTSARNFFDRQPSKAFDQNLFTGFTFGGPIIRNKLFFFGAGEWVKSDIARFRRYTDNTGLLRPSQGQDGYLNLLAVSGDSEIRRIGQSLRNALTVPNYPQTMQLLTSNEGQFTAPTRTHNWMTRLDAQPGSQDSINLRLMFYNSNYWDLPASNTRAPSNTYDVHRRDYTVLGAWTHSFNSSLHNLLRMQVVPNDSATTASRSTGSPTLSVAGVATFGRHFGTPFNTFQDRYQFENLTSYSRGNHLIKFGASYRPVRYRVVNEVWFGGEWTFSSGIYPALLAVPPADRTALGRFNASQGLPANGPAASNLTSLQSFSHGLPYLFRQGFGNPEWIGWTHFIGTFVQDSWKVAPRFTVDLGVRFDIDREPAPLSTYRNAAPRLGFAWDMFGDHKTVIRGGAGLFYSPVWYQVPYATNLINDSGDHIRQIFRTPADGLQAPAVLWGRGIAIGKLPSVSLSEADLMAAGVSTGPRSPGRVVFEADRGYRNNYAAQASFGLTRQLAGSTALDIAWLMYRGVHIQLPHERNYRETGTEAGPGLGPRLTAIDPTITQRNVYSSIGNSIYHGLTASLSKRFSRRTMFQIHYTFSKSIDDVTDFNSSFAAFLPTRLDLERAISTFHIGHSFVASGIFLSPFQAASSGLLRRALGDITFSPAVFLRSGIPFTLRIGRDTNGDTHGDYDRPVLASRNTGTGDNYYGVDFRLTKLLFLHREKKVRIELVAEAANVLNHTNMLAVNDVVGADPRILFGPFNLTGDSSLPSTSPLGFTAAADPRRFQFGLKIAF